MTHALLAVLTAVQTKPTLWQSTKEALPHDPISLGVLVVCLGLVVFVLVAGARSSKDDDVGLAP